MTNTKKSSNSIRQNTAFYRRPIFWITIVIIIVALAVAGFFLFNHKTSDASELSNREESTSEDKPKDQPVADKPNHNEDQPNPEPKVTQYEGEDPNTLNELTGVITSKDIAAGNLTIMVNVDQFLNGSCTLTLKNTQTGQVYSTSSQLLADIATAYCEPFVVPLSDLASGHYQIQVNLSGDNKTGIIEEEIDL